jgi:hypothetical protein
VSQAVADEVSQGDHIDGSANECLWPMLSQKYYRAGEPDAGVEISYRAVDGFEDVFKAKSTPATSTQPVRVTGATAFSRTNGDSRSLWLRKSHSVVVVVVEVEVEVGRLISANDSITDEEAIARTVLTRLT